MTKLSSHSLVSCFQSMLWFCLWSIVLSRSSPLSRACHAVIEVTIARNMFGRINSKESVVLVLGSTDVVQSQNNGQGFCSVWCGWHGYYNSFGTNMVGSDFRIPFAYVGHPANCDGCKGGSGGLLG